MLKTEAPRSEETQPREGMLAEAAHGRPERASNARLASPPEATATTAATAATEEGIRYRLTFACASVAEDDQASRGET